MLWIPLRGVFDVRDNNGNAFNHVVLARDGLKAQRLSHIFDPMAQNKADNKESASWRNIEQTGNRRKIRNTPRVHGFRWLFVGLLAVLLLGLLTFGGLQVVRIWPGIHAARSGPPLQRVYFESDGVLDREWVKGFLATYQHAELERLELSELRASFLEVGQVADAVIAKLQPDGLRIQVRERRPFLRIAVPDDEGRPQMRLVSEDGFIYEGVNYPAASLRRMPYLAGVRLRRDSDGGIQPIRGTRLLTEFLETARLRIPVIVRQWRVVDIANFSGKTDTLGESLSISMDGGIEIVFPTSNFEKAFQRLDAIYMENVGGDWDSFSRIDLTLTNPVISSRQSGFHFRSRR